MNKETLSTLRAQDYERYLCVLMEPASVQPRLFALLAFNQELAKTAEAASDPAIGAIRLKWWHEALQELEAGKPPRKHPVVEALATIGNVSSLYPLIDARMADTEHRQGFADLAAFEDYLQNTAGQLHLMLAQNESNIIREAGAFYALVGLLRAMPYHLERGIVRFPKDILKRYGISPAALEAGVEKEAFGHFMQFWLGEMERRAAALREPLKDAPKLVKRMHIAALLWGRELKRVGGDPSRLPRRLPNLPLKLWWFGHQR